MSTDSGDPSSGAGGVRPKPGGGHEDSATPSTPEGKQAAAEEGEEA